MKPLQSFLSILAWPFVVSCMMPAACSAQASSPSNNTVPSDIKALLGPNDTLLAYKTFDLLGDGDMDAVIVVRHTPNASAGSDQNPCDLIVLQIKNGSLSQVAKSDKAVDCIYNAIAKNAGALSLSDNLKLASQQITYVNQQDKSNTQYTFSYSKQKHAWYVSQLVAIFPQNNTQTGSIDVVKESVQWPKDFSWTLMSDFDPDKFQDALDKHKSFVH
jgi:hypothetical protein